MQITVNNENAGKRLDAYISIVDNKISRTLAQKLIDEERILVNGKSSKSSYKIKENDVVEIPEDAINTSSEGLVSEDIPLEILYEDDDIIVVNKPKNMVVHPGSGVKSRNSGKCCFRKTRFIRWL